MVFSSLPFVLLFMPIFFGIYYAVPSRGKNAILLLGSLVFYAVGTVQAPEHFAIFILSMALDYVLGRRMEQNPGRKRFYLVTGVVFHLLALGFFKYVPFMVGELHQAFSWVPVEFTRYILLPIGISFYTFQGISYLADVYRGTVPVEKSPVRFFVYISMFPQLIAGPIVTYGQVREHLRERRLEKAAVLDGLGTFIFGMGLKVLLANPIQKLWGELHTIGFDSVSTPLAWMGLFAFTFHIYFDFFGYSLMAIGLGKMLGFQLPRNFDFPYLSCTMTEFWRRWHITLGSWFREYVYIPLGGNRKGPWRTVLNLLVVWLLTGIWHGAGYNFLLWGGVLFLLIISEKYLTGSFLQRVPAVGHLYMLLAVPLTWAIFAVDDMQQLGLLFTRLFPFFGQGMWSVFRYDYVKYFGMYWPFFLAAILLSCRWPFRLLERIRHKPVVVWVLLAVIFGASVYCMYRGFNDPFLYFRF